MSITRVRPLFFVLATVVLLFAVSSFGVNASTVVGMGEYPVLSYAESANQTGRTTDMRYDYNGDGITDFLNGLYSSSSLLGENIAAQLTLGASSDSGQSIELAVDTTFTTTASSISYPTPVGDMNGDGRQDFAISATTTDNESEVYIWYGRSTLPETVDLDTEADATISLTDTDNLLTVQQGGDITGDGIGDLIVIESGRDAFGYTYDDVLHIISGVDGSDPLTGNLVLEDISHTTLPTDGETHIDSVVVLNLNGDAYPDFFLTASVSPGTTSTYELFYGGADIETAFDLDTPDMTALRSSGYMYNVRDLNADGNDDVAFNLSGELYMMLGRSGDDAWSGQVDAAEDLDFVISSEDVIGNAASSVYGIDYNNDDAFDLVFNTIGDSYPNGYSTASGSMRVILGGADIETRVDSIDDDAIRFAIASIQTRGDIDGDGLADFLLTSGGGQRLVYGADIDGDGYSGMEGDCQDDNVAFNPEEADNTPDFVDNDCDGGIDEGYTYSFKKNGKLKKIKRKKSGVWEFTYADGNRKRLGSFYSGGYMGPAHTITPNGKYIVSVYTSSLYVIDAYTGQQVVTKRFVKKYKNYARFGSNKVFRNEKNGDTLVVIAHKLRNKKTTRLRTYKVTKKGRLKQQHSILLDATKDKKHRLTLKGSNLTLKLKGEPFATYLVTKKNRLKRIDT